MTHDTAHPKPCPTCGGALPAGTPGAACPKCMLVAGFATGTAGAGPAAAAQSLTRDDIAARFPDYEILGVLGRGGMGVVFKARNKGLDRTVALKVLPPASAATAGFAERFQREARALARLSHANIVGVHEYGEREGVFFLVMEHVDGVSVRQAMRDGRIGARDVLAIVPQICAALQYAHEHGVVHRDIKPENVLIDIAGRVKVADFGLAKIVAGDSDAPDLTLTGEVMGTPHYMAPEQFEKPTTVDHRADIYSLGVVFYEMLTGELPLGRFDPPSHRAQIDVRFDDVVLRSLEKAPERRWQHASDVNREVGTIASGPGRPAIPAAPPLPSAPAGAAAATGSGVSTPATTAGVGNLAPIVATAVVVCALIVLVISRVNDARAANSAALGVGAIVAGTAVLVLVFVKSLRRAFAVRPDGTRRSRLASVACGLSGICLLMLACGAVAGRGPVAALALALGFGVAGFVTGTVAWVRIALSNGRLAGLPQAVTATLVPVVASCLVAPLAYVVTPARLNGPVSLPDVSEPERRYMDLPPPEPERK